MAMTRLFFVLAAVSLASCGSNAPPMPVENGMAEMPGMRMPAPTGNQDRDFAKAMIVHHQGAIDMSRRQLARGNDPGLRKMAGEIIAAQEREIAMLNAYVDANGGR
jgi:uncharacterized protein (DUF305 family)